jgi:RNA recognition motif-containing protein
MERKLYVGGLSYNTTQESLRSYFERVGDVDTVNIITDRETGRSKGFGFVEMATAEDAQAAVENYNGKEFDGRSLTVNEAKPQAPRSGGGGGRGNSGGGRGYGSSGGGRW